ncbi:alpha-dioxygenase 2 [Amborella trichopoda]|uniref:Alpha-dioxygenase 2 n=1 Tax=Amborella trichopoda TaxID=13333 RepID=W1NSE1_AMBTC|nr:alpha-dioxygenase 2 [Amborella trichopoda]ERN00012.1 hypothetical protein AMTR_s00105p00011070 [Amborella trichopoda]|eukprot:XP_006837158.3 alpha-dioxygenase 2 [Amborella trichopoda]
MRDFVHADLNFMYSKMSLFDKFLFTIIHVVDRLGAWHRLPVLLGLAYLGIRRHLHERYNQLHVCGSDSGAEAYESDEYWYRTADGKYNDPADGITGSQGTFFGRNMPPSPSTDKLLDPHPTIVAAKLLARTKFVDNGKQFNMIAGSWIQFMIHDWIDHLEDTEQVEMRADESVAHECPLKLFKFFKTKEVATGLSHAKTGHLNSRTPWWDGSAIYGNDDKGSRKVRSFKEGKLKISSEDGLLMHDEDGIPISGDVRNCWAGFSLLQALFVKEHNAVCNMLKEHYPDLDDEKLYRHARLVTSAVIAKLHTIDWTVELLKTHTLMAGMRINWYGFLGKKLKDTIGHLGGPLGPILSGLVGMKRPQNHGVPYSLTEEFVSVYRMHALLPDKLILRDIYSPPAPSLPKCPQPLEEVDMRLMIGIGGEKKLSSIGFETMMVSMGHQACGALCLWNYPSWMRDLVVHDPHGRERPHPVDMAALEIYRDRERKVARYNEFRRNLMMLPITKWEDLTDDQDAISALRDVYRDDVEALDLQVGLLAEKKIKGFAISETAFFIFLLIASRRLEADRFFTTNFNKESYTEKGFEWVNKTESLKDVIYRHYPDMIDKWMRSSSAFAVWHSNPDPPTYVPMYLRMPS